MPIVRSQDRAVLVRGPRFPTLQRLVDRAGGSDSVTVLINVFASSAEEVPEHTHEVEEVLVVVDGECVITVDGRPVAARAGDAVIVTPGARHSISHESDERCQVVAILASPDVQIGTK